MSKLQREMETAIRAGRTAGEYLLEARGTMLDVRTKSSDVDLVTNADLEAQKIIHRILQAGFQDHAFLEEEGEKQDLPTGAIWIVDPIDGTNNFVAGIPHYCVSIALWIEARPELGLVYDPEKDEMFHAIRGEGAWCNGRKLEVGDASTLRESILATGFPYDKHTSERNNLAEFNAIFAHARGIRRMGAAALDLAYVAAGRLDGFWEYKLGPWDMAAGMLLVEESGGVVTRPDGSTFDVMNGDVAAGNADVHGALIGVLASAQ